MARDKASPMSSTGSAVRSAIASWRRSLTVAKEGTRRPNRERGSLVTERTEIVNQMKAILARFGIRTFGPTLRRVEEKLDILLEPHKYGASAVLPAEPPGRI